MIDTTPLKILSRQEELDLKKVKEKKLLQMQKWEQIKKKKWNQVLRQQQTTFRIIWDNQKYEYD